MSVAQTTANIQSRPQDRDWVLAHDRRHQDDDRRIEKSGGRPELVVSAACQDEHRPPGTARPAARRAKSGARAGRGGQAASPRPRMICTGSRGLDPRHVRPLDHHGDAGGEPEQGEGPAAEIGRHEARAATRTRADKTRFVSSFGERWGWRQGGAFVRGHAQPARALRPPKRRSRRQYSSMAARNVVSSKSGQKSGKEDELRIGRLPGQKVRDALLARGADDEVRIRECRGYRGLPRRYPFDIIRIEGPRLHLLGQRPHGADDLLATAIIEGDHEGQAGIVAGQVLGLVQQEARCRRPVPPARR